MHSALVTFLKPENTLLILWRSAAGALLLSPAKPAIIVDRVLLIGCTDGAFGDTTGVALPPEDPPPPDGGLADVMVVRPQSAA